MKYIKLYENFEAYKPNESEYPNFVDSQFIYDYISSLHEYMEDTNIQDRVFKFKNFVLRELSFTEINIDEFQYYDDTVEEYELLLDKNNGKYPPIVYDSEFEQIIDGTHRCQALVAKAFKTVWAYVGNELDEYYLPAVED